MCILGAVEHIYLTSWPETLLPLAEILLLSLKTKLVKPHHLVVLVSWCALTCVLKPSCTWGDHIHLTNSSPEGRLKHWASIPFNFVSQDGGCVYMCKGNIRLFALAPSHPYYTPVRSLFNAYFCAFLVWWTSCWSSLSKACFFVDTQENLCWNHTTYPLCIGVPLIVGGMLKSGVLVLWHVPHKQRCGRPAKRNQTVSLFIFRAEGWEIHLYFGSLHSELNETQTFLSSVYPELHLWRLISWLIIWNMDRFEHYPISFSPVTY